MKQLFILSIILILTKYNVFGQSKSKIDSNTVFMLVDNMPKFPGGDAKLSEFLTSNFEFSKETKVERCFYAIIIGKEGKVVNVEKLKGDSLNEEKLKSTLKKTSGMWSPPTHNGHNLLVQQNLTIDLSSKKIIVKTYVPQKPN